MSEFHTSNLQDFVLSSRAIKLYKEPNYEIRLESKFGYLRFRSPASNFCISGSRGGGNGKIIICGKNYQLKETSEQFLDIINETGSNVVEIIRPRDGLGEVSLFKIKWNIEENNLMIARWKKFIKQCNYSGLRIVGDQLFASEGAWIDSEKIIGITTDPPNVFVNQEKKIKFLYKCKIIDLNLNESIVSNNFVNKLPPHTTFLPTSHLNPPTTNKQPTFHQEKISHKMQEINYQDDETLVYSSKISGNLTKTLSPQNKFTKKIISNGQEFLCLKRGGIFYLQMPELLVGADYLITLNCKKLSGNGKLSISLTPSNFAANDFEKIIIDGNMSEKKIAIKATNISSKLAIGFLEDGNGEVLISDIFVDKISVGMKQYPVWNSTNYKKNKKFVIVIPSYNNSKWCEKNIESAINQNYNNYRVIFTDDASTDDTLDKVSNFVISSGKSNIVTIISNIERIGALANLYYMINSCEDDEIIITLDGDDWLSNKNVLTYLDNVYSREDIWLTYGQHQNYPGNNIGISRQIPEKTISNNSFRETGWCASHLRSFYSWLFKKIKKEDLMYENDFFKMAWDEGMIFPMLEMASKHSKFISEVLYIYNLENPINDHKTDLKLQQKLSAYIRLLPKYIPLSTITFNELGKFGRIGNQMFQVAALLSLAKNNNAIVKLNWHCSYTNKDLEQYFENKIIQNTTKSNISHTYQEPHFYYEPIPYKFNMNLMGYYQSEKYFKENELLVRYYFEPDKKIKDKLELKYNNVLNTKTCAIHVRRGDFVGNKVHQVCDLNYYLKAIEKVKSITDIDNFVVFSDDISWCKSNINGENFTFIEGNEDIEDMFLISFCSHQIISNSSFSWWGAYLNKNKNKIIITPSKWFADGNHLNDKDIYTENMIKI